MSSDLHDVVLERGDSIKLPIAAGYVVISHRGTLWVTPGDGNDVILKAGQSYRFTYPATALVTPLGGSAKLMVAESPDIIRPDRIHRSGTLLEQIRRLFGTQPAAKVCLSDRT